MFGISRQSYYKYKNLKDIKRDQCYLIISEIMKIRSDHPKMGGKKLFYILQEFFSEHKIKIGRDNFFDILSKNNLLIKQRIRRIRTTYSNHWYNKYKNKIKGIEIYRKNQVWASDITYMKINDKFVFICFIIDVYSKKIVGYNLSETLEAKGPIYALKMAFLCRGSMDDPLIHHSDRGIQYCCNDYTNILKSQNIEISMTESGDPLDNAVAERLNGIIKKEYLMTKNIKDIKSAKLELERAVYLYNTKRPHLSCGMLTPEKIYAGIGKPKRLWKNYYKTMYINNVKNEL